MIYTHSCRRKVQLSRVKLRAGLRSIDYTWLFDGECRYCASKGDKSRVIALQHVYSAGSALGEFRVLPEAERDRWLTLRYQHYGKLGTRLDVGQATREIKRDTAKVYKKVIARYCGDTDRVLNEVSGNLA